MTADAYCPNCKGAGHIKEERNSGDVFTTCWRCGGDGLHNGPVLLTPEGPKRIEVRDA